MTIEITVAEKAILRDVTIPPRPEVLLKISSEGKKEQPDMSIISQAISEDVGISSSVLQIVNSAAFRRVNKIQSIKQAVMTLGIKRLLPLIKSVALKSSMGESERLASFWDHASKIATVASFAAELLQKPALKDHAYMLGLFHNAGVPIMMLKYADYSEVLTLANTNGWNNVADLERQKYQTTHTVVGALLGQKWNLPAVMNDVIYYQFDVEGLYESGELSKTGLDLLSLLKLSRYVVDYAKTGHTENTEWAQVEDAILNHFNLSEEDIENHREYLIERLADN
ncbi:MAG: HD-like signal output (HDOD) protein [Paraglaciecola sp.]|jgi:HD-like signal output (HDOD) protein